MKKIIFILLLNISAFGQVPNTNTFTLQDVTNEIYGNTNSGKNLVDCFADANPVGFDSSYEGSKNSLLNFRNYNNITYQTYSFTTTKNGVVTIFVQNVINDYLDVNWTSTGSVVSSGSTRNADLTGNTSSTTVTVVITIPSGKIFGRLSLSTESITSFDISANTDLNYFITAINNSLATVSVSNNTNLTYLAVNNTIITVLDISTNSLLTNLYVQNTSLSSSEVDDIYVQLDTNGLSNGDLEIDDIRTSASDTARTNLITKGWTITVF
jgi:hypothetical protein